MSATPTIVDRETWNAQRKDLLVREKAHTKEGDAIAAARRRLPMVEVDSSTQLIGPNGKISLLDVFEGRKQLFGSYHMWHTGKPTAEQCEGCTFLSGQVLELSYLHSRDVTYAVICDGPFEESNEYRKAMGWDMPWYGVPAESRERLIAGRGFGMKVCYLRDGDQVFETYWTTSRGAEAMTMSYGILDMTVYGRQEKWEDSPEGWPQPFGVDGAQFRLMEDGTAPTSGRAGRPTPQWTRLRSSA
jgi:predicted dithiol-disulfide oxidoreductase (DUF899 family)